MAAEPDRSSPADTPKTKPYAPRLAPDDRREQLLDASLLIAVRRGFNEITMGSVAKACGVTRPVVYSQFRNRHDLVKAMIDREVSGAIDDLDAAIPRSDERIDARTAYMHGVRTFLTAVNRHPERWHIALAPPHGLPVDLRTMVEEQRRRVITEIEHFVLIAGEAMLPEPDLLSLVVVGMMERIATTMIAEPDRLEIERVMAFAETVFDSLWGAAVQQATP